MKKNQGFTITELMIAVVIMGVLATLAIPSFTAYIYKARVTEASEFGQYCAVDGDDWGTYNPSTIPGIDPVGWATTTEWQQLGAAPDGPIRFQYATVAGVPGVTAPANTNLDEDDHWFAARAQGDLDEDGDTFFLEIYSQSSHIYNQSSHIYNSAIAIGGWE
ncbi:MAG: prepilin-type N-terminal cleavage/methylation domain-containing protein [Deltaproteobacteria bacterium]|nr:prepilin-type N-terminal cleavage/methylation domain-containing protein [Deltaproteobacteria bacterium]